MPKEQAAAHSSTRDFLNPGQRGAIEEILTSRDRVHGLQGLAGIGKTTLIMQILRQIQGRKHSAIVYDPACEFIQRFYDKDRGDIVLNPLDDRCPYWGPSEELRRNAEAKANRCISLSADQ